MKDSFPRHALCPPHPKVTKKIRAELKKRGFNNQDRQMRSVTAELGSEPIPTIGINDGVFYPEDAVPLLPQTRGLTPSRAVRKRPTTGKLRIMVLLADFADNEGKRDAKDFSAMLFSKGIYKTGSMRDFYLENSYGQLDLDGQVIGWLRMPQSYTFYVGSDNGTGAFPNNSQKMVEDALTLAAQQIDFKQFDVDGDAFLDGLFVVFAGGGAEAEEDKEKRATLMWSHQSHLPHTFDSQGIKAFAYCVVPEDGRVGVFSHEFGHMLGLPDLYDTTYKSSGVGVWCIMGAGEWNNDGLTPGHFCAWSKTKLEWVKPQNVKAEETIKLAPVEEDQNAVYRLWQAGKSGDEYFLIENRQRQGFDAKLPAQGLLVWHIDESQHNNDHRGHYMVGLRQADGARQLELAKNDGDTGDPYPGKAKNTSLTPTSNPSTNDVLGRKTSVSISNIKLAKGVISCKVKV
jgi:immune inhibitor A